MRQLIVFVLTLLSLGVIIYHIWLENQFQTLKISGDHFKIEKKADIQDKNDAIQMLYTIRTKLDNLVSHMQKKYPGNKMVERMARRFNGTVLKEANYNEKKPNQSSYTVNKGDTMVLCLRTKDGKMVDENTLSYVAIHELAHIYSSTLHHTEEFWNNMRFLINEAVEAGLYKRVNYAANPVAYCGMHIKSNLPP